MKKKVTAVFDIGKTNKKFLLFNEKYELVCEVEKIFSPILDEDGDECDDIDAIEEWMFDALGSVDQRKFELVSLNFSTYGATLVFVDKNGKRLAPAYNYLKCVDKQLVEDVIERYGGERRFCLQTATPRLDGMLNAGVQILWYKNRYPKRYEKVDSILCFPQYLSSLFTSKKVSEVTSLGCHTFMWDFEHQAYHQWLADDQNKLPEVVGNQQKYVGDINGQSVNVGVGIHDSSASLVPYLAASKRKFILLSTGTWCVNMNPFSDRPLTEEQMSNDCLQFMSVYGKPVKASRLFMGYIHDENLKRLISFYGVDQDYYKRLDVDERLLARYFDDDSDSETFFKTGVANDYIDWECDLNGFRSFDEAYHRLVFDLVMLNIKLIELINEDDQIQEVYVSGGFSKSSIFMKILASYYENKSVYATQISNSSALGAALAVNGCCTDSRIDLGLTRVTPICRNN